MRHEREEVSRRHGGPAPEAEQLPQHELLALQRTAGNRAVGAMLARDTKTAEPADTKEAAPTGNYVIFPGIGNIPVFSIQMPSSRNQPPTGDVAGEREKPKDDKKDGDLPGGDVHFSGPQGKHSTALFKEQLTGQAKDLVVVIGGGKVRITLKNALITAYSVSGDSGTGQPNEAWTVNCTAMKFETVGQE